MGRAPCCDKVGLKKGPWTPEEDQKLLDYVKDHGHGSWRSLPLKAGLLRCGKSCRLRWTNYLRPDIKRGKFSVSEEQTIIQLHALLGNRWSAIASYLPQRTDNEVKNYWNTHLKKRLMRMGLDPKTHNLNNDVNTDHNIDTSSITISDSTSEAESLLAGGGFSSLSHNAQWECARQEAEARLASRDCQLPALDWSRIDSNWQKSLQGQAAKMWPQSGQFRPIWLQAESQLKSDSNDDNQWEEFLSQHIASNELPSLPAISGGPSSPSDEEGGSRLPTISSSCCSSLYSPTSPARGEADNDEWVSILEDLMDTPLTPTSSLLFIRSEDEEDDQERHLF